MKRYYRKSGHEYVENGTSLIRTNTMQQVPSPTGNRLCRVMVVQKVVRGSESNPIKPGALIGISFPSDRINAKEYIWSPGEEFQVPFNIKLEKEIKSVNDAEGDIKVPTPEEEIKRHSVCIKCGYKAPWTKEITGTHRGWCPNCQKDTIHRFER